MASRPEAAGRPDSPPVALAVPPAPDLLGLAAELVDVPSVSGDEAALADLVQARLEALGRLEVSRIGDNVVARTADGSRPRLMLAGHLDTVPPAGNERAVTVGDRLAGVGSADMKGGLAVMLALAAACSERLAGDPGAGPRLAATWCFYTCEEVARSRSGLLEIAKQRPELLEADAAVLLEPTGASVEAGCQGVLKLRLRLAGRRAHAARPWVGENAVHRLGPVLELLSRTEARRPVIGGCEYRESLVAVGVSGGVAGNVVPDLAELSMSYRFAPDRDAESAYAAVLELLGPVLDPSRDELVVEDVSPAAPPSLDHALLDALVAASGSAPLAKLGWTDVATFYELGVPAANFGPGDPLLAHRADEWVSRDQLAKAFSVLGGLLLAPSRGEEPDGP